MKKRYFDLARQISKKSTHRDHHIGAVIVKKNKVVSVGFNKAKTHPKSPHNFKHIHAELDAILGVPLELLKGAEIYTYREKKDGSLGTSKPCSSCRSMLYLAKIKRCYFSTNDGYKSEKF